MVDVVAADAWCRTVLGRQGESRTIETTAGKMHYLVWEAAGTHRPTLLFVHGMRGHAHWWDIIAPHFADRYKVLALDLPGMGDSGWHEAYDIHTFTRGIVSVAERERDSHLTIVGHSFGGSRCLLACATRPDLFERLIVVDSPCWQEGERLPRHAEIGSRIYADKQSALARFRLVPEQPVYAPILREHVAEHSLREVGEGWRWKFDPGLGHLRSLLDPAVFTRLETPMDFVHGELSSIVPPARAALITNAVRMTRRLVCMPGGYHHLMMDQPRELIATLDELLAD